MALSNCRLCGSVDLEKLLELGPFSLSGVFPDRPMQIGQSEIMTLVLCKNCTLVQLAQSFDVSSMFGDNYGYRSGLNSSMVNHLGRIAEYSRSFVQLMDGDVVLDIGSNDGTLLRNYSSEFRKIGVDPSAAKFQEHYDKSSMIVSEFFSKSNYFLHADNPAKIITSIAMLYDLESPVDFANDVRGCLDSDGVWVFEQSYMPWMVITGAYDTICHEHVEYYSLKSISAMLDLAGLKAIDVQLNDANGGSIRVAATHAESKRIPTDMCDSLMIFEEGLNLSSREFFVHFIEYVTLHPIELRNLVESLTIDSKTVIGLGASTKGSILIQNAALSAKNLKCIAEVNSYKVGRWMANSDIPIVQEDPEIFNESDAVIVFPWHFGEFFEERLTEFVAQGGLVIWPLPSISVDSNRGKKLVLRIKSPDDQLGRAAELASFGLTI